MSRYKVAVASPLCICESMHDWLLSGGNVGVDMLYDYYGIIDCFCSTNF